MKLLKSVLFAMLMCISVESYALDNEMQKDLLMSKITTALKAGKSADALPAFAELEGMESSLKKPLPESFDYYYIKTLDKSGDKSKALIRAEAYLKKHGKKGNHYGEVIEIMSRLQDQVEKERVAEESRIQEQKAAEERRIQEQKAAEERRIQEQKAAEERRIQEKKNAEIERQNHCDLVTVFRDKAQAESGKCDVLAFAVGFGTATQRELDQCTAPQDKYYARMKKESKLCNQYE